MNKTQSVYAVSLLSLAGVFAAVLGPNLETRAELIETLSNCVLVTPLVVYAKLPFSNFVPSNAVAWLMRLIVVRIEST